MATFRLSGNSTHKSAHKLLPVMLLGSALISVSCARHVWSDQSERFKLERRALFFDKKVDTIERSARDLNPQQLQALKSLNWTDKAPCTEDVMFFYTLTIYDRNGNENTFHAPDWNCGPTEQKRYIKEEPIYRFFQTLKD
jgi:hypothetical protein